MNDPPNNDLTIAWISRGRLFVRQGSSPPREIESDFAKQALQREFRESELHAWKGRSGVWGNLGMQPPGVAPWENADPRRTIRFVTACRGKSADEILYVLDMGAVGGLFSYDLRDDIECRLVHRQGFVARDVSRNPNGRELAVTLPRDDGTVGLSITRHDGLFGHTVALSDSLDEAPCWLSDGTRRLVFHSAVIGRNEHGFAVGKSPYRIEMLDLESEETSTLLEENGFDLLQPRMTPDGGLMCIRRPHKPQQRHASSLDLLTDIVCFPFRLLRTFVHFFHFMSMMFTGKPLITAAGPEQHRPQASPYLMLWGQMVDTKRMLQSDRQGGQKQPLVPKDWVLIHRSPDGTEKQIAENVLAWDMSGNGEIVWTDGRHIFARTADGTTRKVDDGDVIERVVALS